MCVRRVYDVLEAVVTPAIFGDYVVKPVHLRREEDIEFFGRHPDYREEAVVDATIYEEIY